MPIWLAKVLCGERNARVTLRSSSQVAAIGQSASPADCIVALYGHVRLAHLGRVFYVCFQIETTDRYTHTYCASLAVFIDGRFTDHYPIVGHLITLSMPCVYSCKILVIPVLLRVLMCKVHPTSCRVHVYTSVKDICM